MGVLGLPSPGGVTRAFGVQGHKGTDRGHGNGLQVRSMAAGTVTGVRNFKDYGLTITIDHGRLIRGMLTQTRYRHLSAALVSLGDAPPRGFIIGTQGSSGTLTTQVHLHSELLLNGVVADEQQYQGLDPAGETGEPIPPEPTRRTTMTTLYVKTSTGSPAGSGGAGSRWALAGDAGTPCPANWIEFTRTPADQGNNDKGWRLTQAHGNGIFLSDAEWDAWKLLYTTPVGGGSGGGLTALEHDHLMAVADGSQLATALTSTAALVIDDLTPKVTTVGSKVDGLGISHS